MRGEIDKVGRNERKEGKTVVTTIKRSNQSMTKRCGRGKNVQIKHIQFKMYFQCIQTSAMLVDVHSNFSVCWKIDHLIIFIFLLFFFSFGSFCVHFDELFFSQHILSNFMWYEDSVAAYCSNWKCLPLRYIKTISQETLLVLSKTKTKERSMPVAGTSEKENRKMKK